MSMSGVDEEAPFLPSNAGEISSSSRFKPMTSVFQRFNRLFRTSHRSSIPHVSFLDEDREGSNADALDDSSIAADESTFYHSRPRLLSFPQNQHYYSEIEPLAAPILFQPNLIASSWRDQLNFYIDYSGIGRKWELMDAFLNLGFCGLYIWNTSYPRSGLPWGNRLADLCLALILLIQFLPRNYIAVDFWKFLMAPMTLLTIISTVPVFLAHITASDDQEMKDSYMSAGFYVFVYPFRFMRLHQAIIACLVPTKESLVKLSLISRKAIHLIGFLVFLLLTVAAFVHIVQYKVEGNRISFFDAVFFTIVGRTDIVGDGIFSRLVILFVLASGAIFIPINLAELLRLIGRKSKYDHSFKEKKAQNHVILCGKFDTIAVRSFLKEFFCPDHGSSTVNTHVVILNPNEPTEEFQVILDDPLYINRVQYVKGSTADPRSLTKARLKEAKACFVLSPKYASASAVEDDAETLMRALALAKFEPGIQLHVQVILPENKNHFDYVADTIVCVEELKMGLLAQNCRCPGITSLIYLLTTSITEESCMRLIAGTRNNASRGWLREYIQGANQEIYPTTLSDSLRGIRYSDVASMIYHNFGAVVFALGIPNQSFFQKKEKRMRFDQLKNSRQFSREDELKFYQCVQVTAGDYDLYLNPGAYIVQGGELAFVIASQISVAKAISEFNPQDVLTLASKQPDMSFIARLKMKVGRWSKHQTVSEFSMAMSGASTPTSTTSKPTLTLATGVNGSSNHRVVVDGISPDAPPVDLKELIEANHAEVAAQSTPVDGNGQENQNLKEGKLVLDKKKNGTAANDVMPAIFNEDQRLDRKVISKAQEESNIVTRILNNAINLYEAPNSHGRSRGITISSMDSVMQQDTAPDLKHFPAHLPDHVKDHILVCDTSPMFPVGLEYFIAPLRAKHLETSVDGKSNIMAPIVILSPGELKESQMKMLVQFEDVFVIHGSPLERRDLRKAGVQRCRKAVILANTEKGKNSTDRTADAASILIVLNIETLAAEEDVFIVTEFIHSDNMRFVGDSETLINREVEPVYGKTLMHPAFMAGHVIAQSMMDTILCHSYYNGIFHDRNAANEDKSTDGRYFMSHVTGLFDLHSKKGNGSIKDFLGDDETSGNRQPLAKHSHMWLIKVPSVFEKIRYTDLFSLLAKEHQAIALGLYRRITLNEKTEKTSQLKSEELDNEALLKSILSDGADINQMEDEEDVVQHYVFTNPSPKTLIRSDDRIYVLAVERPDWSKS